MSELSSVSNQLADAVQAAGAWIVRVQARRGPPASGIALAADLVLTADHVVDPSREDSIRIGLPDGSEVGASVVGRDPATDVAILKIASGTLTPATPANVKRSQAAERTMFRVTTTPMAQMPVRMAIK